MKHENVKEILIDRTISVIANEGLDKTTTKAIVSGTDINEVYIYRNFSDKEDLLRQTFSKLDRELYENVSKYTSVMYATDLDYETRCRLYFMSFWSFLTGHREKCLAFVRYFYSPYFTKYSYEEHEKLFKPYVEEIKPAFKNDANVWMLINHILNVMLDFAVKVHNDQMPKEDNYAEHVFRVVYASVKQYFKDSD